MEKVVFKVDLMDQKSQQMAMKIMAKLRGTQSVVLNGEKSLLEVTGDIDPVQLVTLLRKGMGREVILSESASAAVDKEKKDYEVVKSPTPLNSNRLSTASPRKAATHLMNSVKEDELTEPEILPAFDWPYDQPEEKQVHQHEHISCSDPPPYIQKPELVSIGPYHIDKELPLNKYKYSFLETFLSRNQGKDLCFYVQQMMKLESRTRSCYSKVFSMGSYEFVEMMLVDGCFLIQLLTHFGRSEESENGYFPIEPWQIPILVRDLLMLENQIPFFVLEKLFDLSKSEEATATTVSVQSMALEFIDLAFPLSMDFNSIINHLEAPQHLLHLLLHTIRPSNPPKLSTSKAVDEADEVKVYLESTARELQKSGIEFRPRRADRFMDIRFKDGVLEIPAVTINDLFIAILVNGMAFEQCSTGYSKDITAYVSFMSSLIRHPTDVELLCSDGIISRFSHDNEQVVSSLAVLQSKISDLSSPQDSYLYMTVLETKGYYMEDRIPSFCKSLLDRFGIIFSVVVMFFLFFFTLRKKQGKQAMLEESMSTTTLPSIFSWTDFFVFLNLTIGAICFASSLASYKLYRSPSVLQEQRKPQSYLYSVLQMLKFINLYNYLFPETTTVHKNQEFHTLYTTEQTSEEEEIQEIYSQLKDGHVSRTKSDTKPASGEIGPREWKMRKSVPRELPRKMRISAISKSSFPQSEEEDVVENRRPATVREGKAKATEEDDELNARASSDALKVSPYGSVKKEDVAKNDQLSLDVKCLILKDRVPKDGKAGQSAESFTFDELAAATGNFRADCFLGEGGFGKVYRGYLDKTRKEVTIKQLDRNVLQGVREFFVEVLTLSMAKHPNLVKLIGYCAEGEQRLLVYEYMPLGSLENHLHDLPPGTKPLDWNTRMKIAAGAARGLEYLHDKMEPPFIHSNLKCSNILLDEGYHPKLSDFGLAKVSPVGDKTHVSARVMGTYGYCAPGQLTVKSDIYSFGVVLLELISGRKAIDNTRDRAEQNLVEWARPMFKDRRNFLRMVDPLLQGQYPLRGLYQALAIAAMCLQEPPNRRPSISDVAISLNYLASQKYDPSNLLQSSPRSTGSSAVTRNDGRGAVADHEPKSC